METEHFLEDVEGSVVIVAMSTRAASLYYDISSVAPYTSGSEGTHI